MLRTTKTVDSVISTFTQALKDLDVIYVNKATEADEAFNKAEAAKQESLRADRIRRKLEELVK